MTTDRMTTDRFNQIGYHFYKPFKIYG